MNLRTAFNDKSLSSVSSKNYVLAIKEELKEE